jgi:hypothetical protein
MTEEETNKIIDANSFTLFGVGYATFFKVIVAARN